jgi:hypothetical protein
MPTRRISKKTPKTFRELVKARLKKAQKIKRIMGRIKKF